MKTLCRGVLGGLVSFCQGVKDSCKVYGMVDESRLSGKALMRGKKDRDIMQLTTVPDDFIEEMRRVRSLDGDISRLGYNPLILKFYRTEMKSKAVFD